MSMKWGYCKPSGHLKSKMLYVKSLGKLLRASSFHFCYLIVTFIFAHGVMKFLESMALAGIFFTHSLHIWGVGWRGLLNPENLEYFLVFFHWHIPFHNFLFSLSGTSERVMLNLLDFVSSLLDWFSYILIYLFLLFIS